MTPSPGARMAKQRKVCSKDRTFSGSPTANPAAGDGVIPPPARQGGASAKLGYVYLLQSLHDGSFYIGATNHVQRRLDQHNASRRDRSYTEKHGPWRLVGYEQQPSLQAARKREATLKRNPRMRFFFTKRALTSRSGVMLEPSGRVVG